MDESTYITERDRIIEEINTTFGGVRLKDGMGYYEAQIDTWGPDAKNISKARHRDRQSKRWQDLEVTCEERLEDALTITDRDGFHFLFPAYMVLILKRQHGGAEIAEFLEDMRRQQDPRINCFKEKQKRTIAHCLQFIAEIEEWTFSDYPQHHRAKIALREHWGQFLE